MKTFIKSLKITYKLLKVAYNVNKKYFYLTLLLCLLAGALPVATSYYFSQILNFVGEKSQDFESSKFILIIAFYGLSAFAETASYEFYFSLTQYHYRYDLSLYFTDKVIEKVSNLDLEFFENSAYADLKAKALDSFEYKPADIFRNFTSFLKNGLATIFAASAIIYIFPIASLFVIASIIPGVLIDFKFQGGFWGMWDSDAATRRKYGYLLWMSKADEFIKDLRLLNLGSYFRNQIINLVSGIQTKQKKLQANRSLLLALSYILPVIVSGFLIFKLGQDVVKGIIVIGTLSFYISNLFTLRERFGNALFTFNAVITDSKYLETVFEFLEIPQKIKSKTNAIKEIKLPPTIEFKNVTFKYPGSQNDVLKNFNLKIEGGQKIAIVGENGAGKSTLIKLILRFYDVTEGQILINGTDIKDLDVGEWRMKCGVLLQDFVNFKLSNVEDNIGFGNLLSYINDEKLLDESDAKINNVSKNVLNSAKDSMSHDFIYKNKAGYKETVGRDFDGVDFSGGEHQRIALARTFYRNAGLIIMDEPTSAVDAKAEAEIFESIKNHLSEKTVIFVSHRFSTVRIADRIVVIENGRIEEDGKHEELMEKDGLYKKMFNLQKKGYE